MEETMMTGLVEWLSLLRVCVETKVEHKSLDFLSVSILSAFCDERRNTHSFLQALGGVEGDKNFCPTKEWDRTQNQTVQE